MGSSSSDFDEALAYALCGVQQESLTLTEHQVQTVKLLCEGRDILGGFLQGLARQWATSKWQLMPFVIDYKLGRTNIPLVDRSVVVVSPLALCLSSIDHMDYNRYYYFVFVIFFCIFIERNRYLRYVLHYHYGHAHVYNSIPGLFFDLPIKKSAW